MVPQPGCGRRHEVGAALGLSDVFATKSLPPSLCHEVFATKITMITKERHFVFFVSFVAAVLSCPSWLVLDNRQSTGFPRRETTRQFTDIRKSLALEKARG